MARRSFSDECSVLPPAPPHREPDGSLARIWLGELATYLHHEYNALLRFAERHGLLRFSYLLPTRQKIFWVSPRSAQRLIAFARAKQGQEYLEGSDYHRRIDVIRAAVRRHKARKRERAKAERRALDTRAMLALAISGAGAEDEPTSEAE